MYGDHNLGERPHGNNLWWKVHVFVSAAYVTDDGIRHTSLKWVSLFFEVVNDLIRLYETNKTEV